MTNGHKPLRIKKSKLAITVFLNANNNLNISVLRCSIKEIVKNKKIKSFGIILSGMKNIIIVKTK